MPDAKVSISLKYEGRDVDDGTMAIEDVVSALQGFSNAYGRLASRYDPKEQHQIRVSAINKSSFEVLVLAWATQHAAVLLQRSAQATAWIVATIFKLIEAKKHLKGERRTIEVNGNGNFVVLNAVGAELVIPREVADLLKEKTLDGDLGRVVAPLRKGKIENARLSAKDADGVDIGNQEITSEQKDSFRPEETTITVTSKPLDLQGAFISLNKESDRGRFRMENGKTVPYHF